MKAFVAWLVARPQNAILGLVVTLLLPIPGITSVVSSIIVVLLVMLQGSRKATTEVVIASLILVGISLVAGFAVPRLAELIGLFWAPALLLGIVLRRTRSLTLTMQVSLITAVVALVGFFVVMPDQAEFWQPRVAEAAEIMRASGLELNTARLDLEFMTVSAVLMVWTLGTAGFLLGYGTYRKFADEIAQYGLFRDLDFGRVIAFTLALVSLIAFLVDVTWLQNVALLMFVAFWIQGLAIVHYMHAEKMIPWGAVVAVYVLVPLLQVMVITTLAILGYMDAWFGIRRRMKKA